MSHYLGRLNFIHSQVIILANHTSQAASQPASHDTIPAYKQATKLIDELAPADGPGIQYIIFDKDKVIFEHKSGLSDVKSRTPLSLNHTMAALSMTKTITAIAILQLAERQKLNIDDKAAKYIEHPYSPEITIRQLLNHTSGIPDPIPL